MTPSKVPGRGEAAGAVGLAPDDSDETFRKQFSRARERLGKVGIALRERICPDGEMRYSVDAGLSYGSMSDISLQPQEALRLFALMSCCLRGHIPYADDLRAGMARVARLTHTDDAPESADDAPATPDDEPLLEAITQAHARRRPARIAYADADGRKTTRVVRVYGFFQRRGHAYFAAADETSGQVRVFRVSRLRSVSVMDDGQATYDVPADFDVHDFMRLPFQYGAGMHTLVMRKGDLFPEQRQASLTEGHGSWDGDEWSVEAHDARAAAQWATFAALSNDVTPVGDEDVMTHVREGLAKVARVHG